MAGVVVGGFVPGVLHFLSGPDHVAIALVLGLAAGWSVAVRRVGVSLGVGAAALAVGFYVALQQGHVHGLELAPGVEPWSFLGGILFATALISACGAVIFGVAYRRVLAPE